MTGGPQLYGFPPPETVPDLRWLGPDYVSVLVRDLTRGLLRQDPRTSVMGVRCEGEPRLDPLVDTSGVIRAHDACFPLQVFVRDGSGRPWRLRGRWTYSGRGLGTSAASVTHSWHLLSAEGV
ncbi:hypothetical protein BZB76_6018 [Actinomadura pelletieri DSM 43383]|uniref:Uncharacterized protein n=1 Tax=Actinomadura pelletieri DSM 43383 TaxID=1120940 RepID=A0A495QBF6_9ACTN|nr:hypothetical protein [Actinomadura pelletieri]RKS68881.1 hypothetical protein BZB76_6018 [Actinomadura pelletieri DSM 43383]